MLTVFSLINSRVYPLNIDRYHINIAVNNQVVNTKINQTFTNPNDSRVNGLYIFPVTDDVERSNFILSIDGSPVTGELLSNEESRMYYESIVQEGYIGFAEHFGTRAFLADVSIPADSEVHTQFEYSNIVRSEDDLAKYMCPLSIAKSDSGRIAKLRIEMEIESDSELRTIYSPSHEITINRQDDNHARIRYKGEDIDPDDNFECYYSVADDNFGMTLFTHRANKDEDGYFMLLVSPKYKVEKTDIIEKDFIFVLDRSGSMARKKIEQAKEALRYCVQNLNEGDRFNLILFNTSITSLTDRLNRQEGLSAASTHKLIGVEDGREEALASIDSIEAGGGTNINDALRKALDETPDPNRPRIIVFLTDGCPTAGERNEVRILENVKRANASRSRIFVFGVGYEVNFRLLDKMAADNGGTCNYVEPREDIEIAVSSLFKKMNEPVLTDVTLEFGQITTKELSPMELPDIFRGEQFTLFGRYESHGDTTLKLLGNIGNEPQEFSKDLHFAEIERENDFIPHIWAKRKIAELVDQAVLYGLNEELRTEIEHISREHGVETPYTEIEYAEDGSIIVIINIDGAHIGPGYKIVGGRKDNLYQREDRLKRQYNNKKHIGTKTFRRNEGLWVDDIEEPWVDIEYDGHSERKKIEFGSEEYFKLVDLSYDLAKCLKLHRRMIICHDGVNYEIIGGYNHRTQRT